MFCLRCETNLLRRPATRVLQTVVAVATCFWTIQNAILRRLIDILRCRWYIYIVYEFGLDGCRVDAFVVEEFLDLFGDFHVFGEISAPVRTKYLMQIIFMVSFHSFQMGKIEVYEKKL